VSTRSIREAVRTLESRGIVETRHGSGVYVRHPDIDHFLGVLKDTLASSYADDRRLFIDLSKLRRMIETDVVGELAEETPAGFP
jgi:GntR family transcriptional regulator, transcriptional repressor for pyruvate dehydrogenase complex